MCLYDKKCILLHKECIGIIKTWHTSNIYLIIFFFIIIITIIFKHLISYTKEDTQLKKSFENNTYLHGLFTEKTCREKNRSLVVKNTFRIYDPILLPHISFPGFCEKNIYIFFNNSYF